MIKLFLDEDILQAIDRYADDLRNHPELRWDQTYFDMTREEQMRAWWEKLHTLYKLDANKYFYERTSGTFTYEYMHPGISPLTVHNQMFTIAVEKLASEEQN